MTDLVKLRQLLNRWTAMTIGIEEFETEVREIIAEPVEREAEATALGEKPLTFKWLADSWTPQLNEPAPVRNRQTTNLWMPDQPAGFLKGDGRPGESKTVIHKPFFHLTADLIADDMGTPITMDDVDRLCKVIEPLYQRRCGKRRLICTERTLDDRQSEAAPSAEPIRRDDDRP